MQILLIIVIFISLTLYNCSEVLTDLFGPETDSKAETIFNSHSTMHTNRQWQGIPRRVEYIEGKTWVAWYSGGEGEGNGNFILFWCSDDLGNHGSKIL